jgi:protein TonB
MLDVVAAFAAAIADITPPKSAANGVPLSKVEWVRRPNPSPENFPPAAARANKSGIATVECKITAKGTMDACTVLYEAPEGFGFGEAAVRVAKRFQIKPTTTNGDSVEGGHAESSVEVRDL